MPVGSTGRIIKILLILLLVILLVIEFISLFLGIALIILPSEKKVFHNALGLFMVINAGLLICLAFVGICGAARECYLKLFVFAGLVIAVLLVSLAVHLFMLPIPPDDSSESSTAAPDAPAAAPPAGGGGRFRRSGILPELVSLTLSGKIGNISNTSMELWDDTHRKFRCCGLYGPKSWIDLNLSIPYTCCHIDDNSSDPFNEYCSRSGYGNRIYIEGCLSDVKNYIKFTGATATTASPGEGNDGSDGSSSSSSGGGSNITMVTIIRTAGYFIQLAAVVLAIWLGILILLSYHCGYY